MSSDVEELYKNYGILADAGANAGQHADSYEALLKGVKGSTGAKRLAADFITKFFKHFPDLSEKAVEAQIDLCEDEDPKVRQAAIRSLPELCREGIDNVQIADVLTQLLQTEDAHELQLVRQSLGRVLEKDSQGALAGLFFQLSSGEDLAREKALGYLSTVVVDRAATILNSSEDRQQYVLEEVRKAFSSVTGLELPTLLGVLRSLEIISTQEGAQHVVDMLADLADLDSALEVSDGEARDRLFSCARHAVSFATHGASTHRFVQFLVSHVLSSVASLTEDVSVDLFKVFAELCGSSPLLEVCQPTLDTVFHLLLEYLPVPITANGTAEKQEVPDLKYSAIECLLFAFHHLARKLPAYLSAEEEDGPLRLRELRFRLQYCGQCSQPSMRRLKTILATKTQGDVHDEMTRAKLLALRTLQNIFTLTKDFLTNPPSYSSSVVLSFVVKKKDKSPVQKRRSSSNDNPRPKRIKTAVYEPPKGEYSQKAGKAPQLIANPMDRTAVSVAMGVSQGWQPSSAQRRFNQRGGAGRGNFRGRLRRTFTGAQQKTTPNYPNGTSRGRGFVRRGQGFGSRRASQGRGRGRGFQSNQTAGNQFQLNRTVFQTSRGRSGGRSRGRGARVQTERRVFL